MDQELTGWRIEREEARTRHGERGGRDDNAVSVVCAWWTGNGDAYERPGGGRAISHTYKTQLKPTMPLKVGAKVRLLALPMTAAPAPLASIDQYAPYEPHVRGIVARVISTGDGWARATIVNTCRGNEVGIVELDVPYVPGVTVEEDRGHAPRRVLAWMGEAPEGCESWRDEPGTGEVCGGRVCVLDPVGNRGLTSFRVEKPNGAGRKGRTATAASAHEEEATVAIHLWLKYEGYD